MPIIDTNLKKAVTKVLAVSGGRVSVPLMITLLVQEGFRIFSTAEAFRNQLREMGLQVTCTTYRTGKGTVLLSSYYVSVGT